MGSFQRLRASRQLLLAFSNSNRGALQTAGPRELPFFLSSRTPSRRHASSADSSKPIILEQPDKFRPPSHPSRLVQGRGRGSTYNGAYNQSSTAAERIAQKNRRYPHMFPDEGTLAHSIITKKQWHVLITMGVLVLLALVTWIQTFIKTSPFGHLMPSFSSLFKEPLQFFQDVASVFRLDQDYNTEKVEFERARNILDAQKRRIYRRAHGMEDLDRDEDQGVDVRGIVPWDDGLTKREREAGGIGANRIKMISAMKVDDRSRQAMEDVTRQKALQQDVTDMKDEIFIRRREAELGLSREEDPAVAARKVAKHEEMLSERDLRTAGWNSGQHAEEVRPEQQQKRRKLWFGIW